MSQAAAVCVQVFSALVARCAVHNGTILASPYARSRARGRRPGDPFGYDPAWLADSPLYDALLTAEAAAWYNATTEVDAFTGLPHAYAQRRLRFKAPGTLLVFDRALSRIGVEVCALLYPHTGNWFARLMLTLIPSGRCLFPSVMFPICAPD